MKRISIVGGKGGTGKSTFSILLANKLTGEGKRVVLCDCDVECPNDYILLRESLKKVVDEVFAEFPRLNKKKCKKCGLCVKVCRGNAIFQLPGQYPVFIKDLCSGCSACWVVCPNKAIEAKKEKIGEIYLNKVESRRLKGQGDFYLITGLAKAGLEETGPVVKKEKEFALRFSQKIGADFVLFDAPAGTHCPVIQTLLGVNYSYVVTEPTPMGAYDLALILNLLKKLKIKPKIILNQADLGDRSIIENILESYKIKIDKEIPYSKEIVDFYSKGELKKIKNYF